MDTDDIGAAGVRKPGFDALMEDLFGLNVRGMSTVSLLIAAPAKVFTAARDPHWGWRFTPSIRLVIWLVAVLLVLRFFWESEDSYMFRATLDVVVAQIRDYFAAAETPPTEEQILEMATNATRIVFQQWAVAYPFTFIAIHFLLASGLRIWGKGTSYVTRLRLYFLPLAIAVILTIASTLVLGLAKIDADLWIALWIGLALAFIAYWVTVFRGLSPVHNRGARAWRATLYGLVASGGDAAASFSATWVGVEVGRLLGTI